MPVYRLENTIQRYDWGSPAAMQELLGIPNPEGEPMAELWIGAHPRAPSSILEPDGTRKSLLQAIENDPEGFLGQDISDRFLERLPFLFKVLSAERSLSIQAHPTREQARAGFQRENARGIPLDADNRNYRDTNHKPELFCALSEFWALFGFRPLREILREFSGSGWNRIARPLRSLEEQGEPYGLEQFFRAIMESGDAQKKELVDEALALAESRRVEESTAGEPGGKRSAGGGSGRDESRGIEAFSEPRYYWITELNRQYPGDIGVLAPLYLNCIRLEPGEAIASRPGLLHSYLRGTGVEALANSDNVLRGGLTSKHIDLPELLHVVSFYGEEPAVLSPRAIPARSATDETADGDSEESGDSEDSGEPGRAGESGFAATGSGCTVYAYPIHAEEFSVHRIDLEQASAVRVRRPAQPEVLLCVSGTAAIRTEDMNLGGWCALERGESAFVTAGAGSYELSGTARLFRAAVPAARDGAIE